MAAYEIDWATQESGGAASATIFTIGNRLFKSGANAWDNYQFASAHPITGDGYIEVEVAAGSAYYMIGLAASSPTVAPHYNDSSVRSYLFHVGSTSYNHIYENGAFVRGVTTSGLTGDIIRLEIKNKVLSYYLNGALEYRSLVTAEDYETFYPCTMIYSNGGKLANCVVNDRAGTLNYHVRSKLDNEQAPVQATVVEVQWNLEAQVGDDPIWLASYDYFVDNATIGQVNETTIWRPRLLSVSPLTYGVQGRAPAAIQRVECRVEIADPDKYLMGRLSGVVQQRRVPINIWWAFDKDKTVIESYTDADGNPGGYYREQWQPLFKGILDRWEYRDAKVVLVAHVDDFWMTGYTPKVTVLASDWAAMPQESDGALWPVVWGEHDGSNHSGTGFLRALKASWTSANHGDYIASLGTLQSVDRVYVAGVLKTLSTHYTVDYAYNAGGKICTLIQFTGANTPAATADVTFDAHGLTGDGTQAGGMIRNPVAQLRHAIENFMFADWRRGGWAQDSNTSPLDGPTWDEMVAFSDSQLLEGTMVLGGGADAAKIADVIGAWLTSWQLFRLYWTPEGKLAIGVLPWTDPGYGDGSRWDTITEGVEVQTNLASRVESDELIRKITGSYVTDEAGGKLWNTIQIIDPSVDEDTMRAVDQSYGLARLV